MEAKQAQMPVCKCISYGSMTHSDAEEIQVLYSPETLKPSICWVWFSVKPQSGFGPHRCAFSPQWIVPAINCRLHNWLRLAECLDLQNTHLSRKSNWMYRHHMDMSLHARFVCVHTHVHKYRCNNSGAFKSLVMNCLEMSWTGSLFSGYLTCFCQQPRIYL